MNNKCWVIVDDGVSERTIAFFGDNVVVTTKDNSKEMSHSVGDVFMSEVQALRELVIRLRRKIQQNANAIRQEPPKRDWPFRPYTTY